MKLEDDFALSLSKMSAPLGSPHSWLINFKDMHKEVLSLDITFEDVELCLL